MLQDINNVSFHDTEKDSLITPELWFRSCQSPLNNSTENICLTDTHFTSSLYNNRITETEQNNTEKLIVSNQKVSKKKKDNKFYMFFRFVTEPIPVINH